MVLLVVSPASARPPPGADPALAPWYQSLTNPHTGGSCCDIADCRILPVRILDGHYEVDYNGSWRVVPSDVVSARPDNPTGNYVTCVRDFHGDGVYLPQIDCFILSPGT